MKVIDLIGAKPVKGDCGVELEVELSDRGVYPEPNAKWRMEYDGSLRGNAYEFVMRKPLPLEASKVAVREVYDCIKATGSDILDTGRAGTHVHVNVQDLSLIELYNFICCYLIVEELITETCGKYRQGNLFCLRAVDANNLVDTIEESLKHLNPLDHYNTDSIRYAAMNLKAIPQYGSLEFRAMGTITDPDTICDWASLLIAIRDNSKKYQSPVEIYQSFSVGGEEAFLTSLLKEKSDRFMHKGWKEKLKTGVRLSQYIAYTTNWEKFQ